MGSTQWTCGDATSSLPSQLVISFLVPLSLTILSLFQTINLAASCTHKDYNTCPLYTIYSNFIDVLPVVCLTFTLLSLSLSLCVSFLLWKLELRIRSWNFGLGEVLYGKQQASHSFLYVWSLWENDWKLPPQR